MADLKVGDRVRCVHGNREQLREGCIYEVSEVATMIGVQLVGLYRTWPGMLFGAWRFEVDDGRS